MFANIFAFLVTLPQRPDAPFWWLVIVGTLSGTGIVLTRSSK